MFCLIYLRIKDLQMSGSFTCELTLEINQYKYTLFSSAPLITHGATFFSTLSVAGNIVIILTLGQLGTDTATHQT